MRYERVKDIVRLAVRLQGTHGGLTLEDIQADFSVSRRTAERMRDAVEAAFGPLELVDTGDAKRHWRLRSDALRRIAAVSSDELAELESGASALERAGLEERSETLRDLATKLRATFRTESLARIASDLEALVQAEGLAMRAGPRPRLAEGGAFGPQGGDHDLPRGGVPVFRPDDGPAQPATRPSPGAPIRESRVPRCVE